MTPVVLTLTDVIGSWQPQQLDVIFHWNPLITAALHHYTLYEAIKTGRHSGRWQEVARIPKAKNLHVRTVPDHGNFTWYITATDDDGNETQASNTVDLYANTPKGLVTNPGRLQT